MQQSPSLHHQLHEDSTWLVRRPLGAGYSHERRHHLSDRHNCIWWRRLHFAVPGKATWSPGDLKTIYGLAPWRSHIWHNKHLKQLEKNCRLPQCWIPISVMGWKSAIPEPSCRHSNLSRSVLVAISSGCNPHSAVRSRTGVAIGSSRLRATVTQANKSVYVFHKYVTLPRLQMRTT